MKLIWPLIFLFLIGVATAYFAQQRGRDPYAWFVIGLFLGLAGFLLLMFLPDKSDQTSFSRKEPDSRGLPLIIEATPDEEHPHHGFLVKDWYYVDQNKKQIGPISFDQLKQMWVKGELSAENFVWSEGMREWKQIAQLPAVLESLRQ